MNWNFTTFLFYICLCWCGCSFDYKDLQFHLFGHEMKCPHDYIHNHLIRYMTKYGEAMKYIGKTFLLGKGQTLQDNIGLHETTRE